jgi:hypothetical protein
MRLVSVCLVISAAAWGTTRQPLQAQAPASAALPATAARRSDDPLATRISVSFSDLSLRDALSKIAEQSHVRFMYSSDDLATAERVSLSVTDAPVAAALKVVLTNTALQPIAMPDGAIVLTTHLRRQDETPESSRMASGGEQSTGAVNGRVVQSDGTPVSGATVGLLSSADSSATSDSGRFVLRNVAPGAHTLWVRRLGFRPTLVDVTVSAVRPQQVRVTLDRAVPVLATVVTTSEVEAAYRRVGLDQRMRSGLGQFLTYDQIQKRHARKLSELLQGMRGIEMFEHPTQFEAFVGATRGAGSCITLVVDGIPQNERYSQNAAGAKLPPDDADDMIDPSGVGAIEVYSSAERPAGFGDGGQTPEALPPPPGTAMNQTSAISGHPTEIGTGQCVLVMIWTRTRLGLAGGD